MEQRHITLDYVDGHREEFDTTTFMCRADRRAFKKHFNLGITDLRRLYDEDGKLREDADFDEDWDAFFVWKAWARAIEADTVFDAFVDSLADVEISDEQKPGEAPLQAVTSS